MLHWVDVGLDAVQATQQPQQRFGRHPKAGLAGRCPNPRLEIQVRLPRLGTRRELADDWQAPRTLQGADDGSIHAPRARLGEGILCPHRREPAGEHGGGQWRARSAVGRLLFGDDSAPKQRML